MVTEGAIHFNGVPRSVMILAWAVPKYRDAERRGVPARASLMRKVILFGMAGLPLSVVAEWEILQAVY